MQWLDNASSLDGNGVNEGDTLLLRKKFFILNDDITEAIAGNEELKELIYQQVDSDTKHVVYNILCFSGTQLFYSLVKFQF